VATIHFLLVYDVRQQRLIRRDDFADAAEAAAAYAALEAAHRMDRDFEIVLVGADSIETIMRTHGHYFAETDLVERSLVGA
jgi:hypothetical protein